MLSTTSNLKIIGANILSTAIAVLAMALVVVPVLAEVLVLLTLGSGTDTINERNWVMTITVYLLVAVALPPLVTLVRAITRVFKETENAKPSKTRK